MPELEREDELAARRDEITKRRQKADLAAMLRTQQDAGKKKSTKSSSIQVKPRKLKRANATKKQKKKKSGDSEDDVGDNYADEDVDDNEGREEEDEEDEEESDYEKSTTRRGNRSRKATGTSSKKVASLSKLKKRRSKAEKRRKGQNTDEESSEDESSEYDEEAQEILNRKAKERDRREKDAAHGRREVKASREEERIAQKKNHEIPSLIDINAARLKKDHFTRMIHRPDWVNQLLGKFVRISLQLPIEGGRFQQIYRLAQITSTSQREQYYEVADQCTNVYCTLTYGEDKMEKVRLQMVSNQPILEEEYIRWRGKIDVMPEHKMQRLVPSKEATLDMSEDLEAFINRPFTEQDINDVIVIKKQAREAYNQQQSKARQPPKMEKVKARAGYDEALMAQMNEKHRKADRERIAEAERRNAAKQKRSANVVPPPPTAAVRPPAVVVKSAITEVQNGGTPKKEPTFTSLSLAAANINVDLGDF